MSTLVVHLKMGKEKQAREENVIRAFLEELQKTAPTPNPVIFQFENVPYGVPTKTRPTKLRDRPCGVCTVQRDLKGHPTTSRGDEIHASRNFLPTGKMGSTNLVHMQLTQTQKIQSLHGQGVDRLLWGGGQGCV